MSCSKEVGEISGENSFKLEWKIDNFFSYSEEDIRLKSPDFLACTVWYIQIAPNGLTKHSSNGHVSLYLYSRSELPKTVEYRLGIKTVNNTIDYEKVDVHTFCNLGRGYHWFLKRSDLLQRKSELVPSGSLTVACTVTGKNNVSDLDSSKYKS